MSLETIGDLIKAFREDEKDTVGPEYFWSDPQLVRFANGALVAFAEKTLSIVDDGIEVQFSAGQDLLSYAEYIIDVLDAELVIGGRTWDLDIKAPADVRRSQLPKHGRPCLLVVNNAIGSMRLAAKPSEPGSVRLTVIRRPAKELAKDSKITDVNRAHRKHLLLYLKHRAYNVNDSEMFDPAKAAGFLNEFNYECQQVYEAELRRRSGARRIKPAAW
ncbi:hypothetical protein [Pseudomonas sp. SO81]|uniref:hypothetical protein n=1 Tax=Pseudomonas sp. SO81 TaxID=2983246 RepID=UPI0025A38511|nr:hypothetical protein [Pseudomonas sp. SO81]WJN61365.1 hypothetical protein OH686_21690 [Pseudomonas sp. SO81]